jgi:hypothetical protein
VQFIGTGTVPAPQDRFFIFQSTLEQTDMKLKSLTLAAVALAGFAAPSWATILQTFDFRYPSLTDVGTNQGYVMTADKGLEVSITSTLDGFPTKFNRDPDGGGPTVVNTRLDWSDPQTFVLRSAFITLDGPSITDAVSGFAFPTEVTLVSMELVAFAGTCGFSAGIRIDEGEKVFLPYNVNGPDPDPGADDYCRVFPEQNVLQFRQIVEFDFEDPNSGQGPIISSGLLLSGNAFSIKSLTVMGEAAQFPPNPAPEPGSLALLAAGSMGIAALRRRRVPSKA